MNRDRIKGGLKQFKGMTREEWGRVKNDEWTILAGKRDQLAGKLQKVHGVAKEKVEQAAKKVTKSL